MIDFTAQLFTNERELTTSKSLIESHGRTSRHELIPGAGVGLCGDGWELSVVIG